ncbi:hypothetical protein MHYP_G00128720 [Metynnis hypsauchen]
MHCPPEFWPNTQRDSCLPKPVEFLSWDDTLSIILTVFCISGAFIAESYYTTCVCLSDTRQYSAFFRTVPSDHHQVAVHSDSDYGNNGMTSFLKNAQEEDFCVESPESFYRTQLRSKIERVANIIWRSTAREIVTFLHEGDIRFLMEELTRKPPPLQWIGSEAWIIDPELLRCYMCAGAIGFGIPQLVIPGLREFLLNLSLAQALK